MKKLNESEAAVLDDLLEQVQDYLSGMCCNDYTLDYTEENVEMVRASVKWNDPNEEESTTFSDEQTIYGHNGLLFSYLIARLKGEV